MNKKSIGIVILGGCIQASGTFILKLSTSMLKNNNHFGILGFALAILLFCLGFPLYSKGLTQLKLSIAQPLFSSTLFLVSTLLSIFILNDKMQIHQFAGIVAIIAGVVIVISSTDSAVSTSS